jgi:lipopolysaccharide/colanic/teichoic acid biosynthesis glycosyltransferase
MSPFDFDYEVQRRGGSLPNQRRRKTELQNVRRAKAILFNDDSGSGSYYYDLRTRHAIGARAKRLFDLLFATVAITLLAPLFLLIAALVRLSGPGPIIFRQRRIGFRCIHFDMYKFRTMFDGAHLLEKELAANSGKSFLKLKHDPRVTPIGRILRKYSLDELPQLFNVLEGTMSLVGPRPLLVSDLDKLPRRSGLSRFSTPPGITGLWQVSGRSSCSDLKRLRLDRHYVEHWSFGLDMEILLRTIEVVVAPGRDAV